MASNAQQILADVISQERNAVAPELSEQEFFEYFSAQQILKDYGLSYEELESGIVDGEHDGGIDSIFAFVNGTLIHEDMDISSFKKEVHLELFIIQSKTAKGFSESALDKLISSTRKLLKLDQDFDELLEFNERVKSQFDSFRQTYRSLAARFPKLKIHYFYCAKRADARISPNLSTKSKELEKAANELFPDATIEVKLVGAAGLIALARRRRKVAFQLGVSQSLNDGRGYVVLSKLEDFNAFLRDENGKVIEEIFESNVRDSQGMTVVNKEITQTLLEEKDVDFWMLNNGITILGSRVTLTGKTFDIENPQIVNGLQTSTQIANYFDSGHSGGDRKVMIKIVTMQDDEGQDKIIKSTNSQNTVQPASLRATDKIQRDIEAVLKTSGIFYDRRKNYYKNKGKPAAQILSIPLLAQGLMASVLARPDTARARPSTLIKKDEDYSKLFSENHPIDLYVVVSQTIKKIDLALRSRSGFSAHYRNNIRFYVLYFAIAKALGSSNPSASSISKLKTVVISDDLIEEAIDEISILFEEAGATDQTAKGPDFIQTIKQKV